MLRFKIALLLAALGGLATSSAQAGLMPTTAMATPETGTNLYSYGVALTSGSTVKTGDYFTVYDVAGYVAGSATTPTGWSVASSNLGTTPANVLVTDSATVPNLTFTYTGATAIAGGLSGATVGAFAFDASSTPIPTYFASQTHTGTGNVESSVIGITPTINSPGGGGNGGNGGNPQTPEPASLLLLGMALPFAGLRRWMGRKE